jgi:hypothetical protein
MLDVCHRLGVLRDGCFFGGGGLEVRTPCYYSCHNNLIIPWRILFMMKSMVARSDFINSFLFIHIFLYLIIFDYQGGLICNNP